MSLEDKIEMYLLEYSFEEILEQNDLTEMEVLFILYRTGNLALPDWLEDEVEEFEDEL